jgi:hypothetical protein
MRISIIGKNLGKVDREVEVTKLSEVVDVALEHDWSPSTFSTDTRSVANFKATSLLVLDVDEGCCLEQAQLKFSEYNHAILLSKSHNKEKNGVVSDRFRVVIPMEREVTDKDEYEATWLAAQRLWPFIDKSCRDASRFYYRCTGLYSGSTGRRFTVEKPKPAAPPQQSQVDKNNAELLGKLSRKTLEFLTLGAPAGSRHNALVAAVGDMRDQNFEEWYIEERIRMMTQTSGNWNQPDLSPTDIKTISDVYARERKYDLRPQDQASEATLTNTPVELIEEALDYLSDKAKVKGDATGVEGLDKVLGGGFRTGELTVLMAQAKTGKNSFYHYLIYQMMQRGVSIAYASRELSPAAEVIPNLISIATGNNAWKAEITDTFKTFVREMASRWPLRFAAGYGYFPPDKLVAWMREMKESGVNHFLIDHLHYCLKGEDYESTAELIKIIKTQTKELDVHVNLIVQPRSLREGEKLSLSTLRGGAAIGQALDNLLILERVRGESNISKLSLEVARHKLAKPGSVYLSYDSESTLFTEVDRVLVQEEPDFVHDGREQRRRTWPRTDS